MLTASAAARASFDCFAVVPCLAFQCASRASSSCGGTGRLTTGDVQHDEADSNTDRQKGTSADNSDAASEQGAGSKQHRAHTRLTGSGELPANLLVLERTGSRSGFVLFAKGCLVAPKAKASEAASAIRSSTDAS